MGQAEGGRGRAQKSPHSNTTTGETVLRVQKRLRSQHHGQRPSDINREVPWRCCAHALLSYGQCQRSTPHPNFPQQGGLTHQTWAEHTSKHGCSPRAAGWEGEQSKAAPLPADPSCSPKPCWTQASTLLPWPDTMHEGLRFQQASA